MPQAPDDEVMHQPVAFIGIGSKNEQEMQQLIIEDKVSCLTIHTNLKACQFYMYRTTVWTTVGLVYGSSTQSCNFSTGIKHFLLLLGIRCCQNIIYIRFRQKKTL